MSLRLGGTLTDMRVWVLALLAGCASVSSEPPESPQEAPVTVAEVIPSPEQLVIQWIGANRQRVDACYLTEMLARPAHEPPSYAVQVSVLPGRRRARVVLMDAVDPAQDYLAHCLGAALEEIDYPPLREAVSVVVEISPS